MQETNPNQGKPETHSKEKAGEKHGPPAPKMIDAKSIVRVLSTDIDGNKKVFLGLKRIKGISFMFSNAICARLGINKHKKMGELTRQEIENIEKLVENPKELPEWLVNRRNDMDTGNNLHLTTAKLKLVRENDIKMLKKVKSYRGMRHALGLPTRGQRTKSHFRHGKKVGVVKKKVIQAKAAKPAAAGAKK